MKLINGTAIGQGKTGYAFAGRDASGSQALGISTRDVRGGRITFQFVVEINDAGIERHDVANLIDQYLHRILHIERGAKGAGNFVKCINFLMRTLNLIVGHVAAAFAGLHHVHFV